MFIETHILQNFAPSNLNRDDTNNPKECEFGGVRRARISSQCIKRAIRCEPVFEQTTAVDNGTRTRLLARHLTDALKKAGKAEDDAASVADNFSARFVGALDKNRRTNVLIYLSAEEKQQIVDALLERWEEVQDAKHDFKGIIKEIEKAVKNRTSAPDIALFGRMLAENPNINLEAACQVAHALSTHRATMEMDFFTAVDDLQGVLESEDRETGSAMMGITGFYSACFYRYARIDWGQLLKNLDGDTALARSTVKGFLLALVLAVPTGKQSSFAAQNPPGFLLGVLRMDGKSWSLANAFERPVRAAADSGLLSPSIAALDKHWGRLSQVYGSAAAPLKTAALAVDQEAPVEHLAEAMVDNLDAWVGAIVENLPKE